MGSLTIKKSNSGSQLILAAHCCLLYGSQVKKHLNIIAIFYCLQSSLVPALTFDLTTKILSYKNLNATSVEIAFFTFSFKVSNNWEKKCKRKLPFLLYLFLFFILVYNFGSLQRTHKFVIDAHFKFLFGSCKLYCF